MPVWRSLLYVPVNVERFVAKAHLRNADVIQLDLEDSVPPSEKAHARTLLDATVPRVRQHGADVVVRINRPLSLAVRDIEHAVIPGVDGLAITKVDSASHIRMLDELVSELELARGLPVGNIRFIAMIETARAFGEMDEILRASPRIAAANIGGEDFATDCGMAPLAATLAYPKQRMIIAAAAAGVMPLGFIASVADYGDTDVFRTMVRESRQFGFMGASAIHPSQVAVLNEAYGPSGEEVAFAKQVVSGYAQALERGTAAFAIDGQMIDIPVVQRAERLLARHEAIEQRQSRKLPYVRDGAQSGARDNAPSGP